MVAARPVENDEWHGDRFVYALTLRPFSTFNLPSAYQGYLIMQTPEQRRSNLWPHGTVTYTVELPESVTDHFDLVRIT